MKMRARFGRAVSEVRMTRAEFERLPFLEDVGGGVREGQYYRVRGEQHAPVVVQVACVAQMTGAVGLNRFIATFYT